MNIENAQNNENMSYVQSVHIVPVFNINEYLEILISVYKTDKLQKFTK